MAQMAFASHFLFITEDTLEAARAFAHDAHR